MAFKDILLALTSYPDPTPASVVEDAVSIAATLGAHLAAVWSPVLEPSDASDLRFGEIIANGSQFKIQDLLSRNASNTAKVF